MLQGQSVHHVALGPAGADVLGTRQVVAEKPVQPCLHLTDLAPRRDSDLPQGSKQQQREQRKCGQHHAGDGVLPGHHDQDPDHQEEIAYDVDHEPGEEAGESCRVPVDPLDQFSRRAGLVETEVQLKAMKREVGAERVGRPPRDALADVLRFRRHELIQERDADKEATMRWTVGKYGP